MKTAQNMTGFTSLHTLTAMSTASVPHFKCPPKPQDTTSLPQYMIKFIYKKLGPTNRFCVNCKIVLLNNEKVILFNLQLSAVF